VTTELCAWAGPKRYRIASMVRDLRDLFSLTMHIRKHGLEAKDTT
jgi:hypothetical protein